MDKALTAADAIAGVHRRSVLAGSGLALAAVAGCSSTETSTPDCQLSHEVVSPSDDHGEPLETYRYENLSDDARTAVDVALEDGHYATTEERMNPPEFRYWDETALYEIRYRNETYLLLTYSSAGCEPR